MTHDSRWLHFDVHGRVGIRVDSECPAALQLRTMLACFASDSEVPPDICVTGPEEALPTASCLEDELAYTDASVRFLREGTQVVRDSGYRISGRGELLTTLVPLLDRAMVEKGAGMIHAATVALDGQGIALPAAGGTGKTSTVAKLMRRDGWAFMGDDWAFLDDRGNLLGYEKPMFIKPHHRLIYPHLFEGAHKPMVPSRMSGPVGRLTTRVHPLVIHYPRLANFARQWSPEHRMITAAEALPGVPVVRSAPLTMLAYVERYAGTSLRAVEVDRDWMVDRMIGNFHIEMAGFSQHVVSGLAAASFLPWTRYVQDKAEVLRAAVDGLPCHLIQAPAEWSADRASDAIVESLIEMLPSSRAMASSGT
jgi:hypothetical protein